MGVGFRRPHLPFVCPERFWDMYPEESIQLPADQQPPSNMPPIAWSKFGELRNFADIKATGVSGNPGDVLDANATLALRRAYYACISHVDEELGRLLAALDGSPFAANTVITLIGDHGWYSF